MAKKRKAAKRMRAVKKNAPKTKRAPRSSGWIKAAAVKFVTRNGKKMVLVRKPGTARRANASKPTYTVHIGHYHLSSHRTYAAALKKAKAQLRRIYGKDYKHEGFTPGQVISESETKT